MSTADEAVLNVLRRIMDDPRVAYYFDPFTRSYELLTAAYAEATGQDVDKIRKEIEQELNFAAPK
jgi:hypothetical protein